MSNADNLPPIDYDDLIKNEEPVDPENQHYQKIFTDLQGGMIKGYGRNYSLYIFISFKSDKITEVKQWIKEKIAQSVTSTFEQLQQTNQFKEEVKELKQQGLDSSTHYGKLCKNFFLSYQGYQALGIEIDTGDDSSFPRGMKTWWERSYLLPPTDEPREYWYSPPDDWDIGGKKQIHALISLTHNGLEELKKEANTIIEQCRMIADIVACEAGCVLKNNKYSIGPFGFVDSISQPLFLKSDYDNYLQQHQSVENRDLNWNPIASLSLILAKDPVKDSSFSEPHSYGSYCVWQKLEVNNKNFEDKVNELINRLRSKLENEHSPNDPSLEERVSALVFGRFQDGTPLTLSNQKHESVSRNDFNYENDPEGAKCPVHAHIRAVNPRVKKDKNNRIFRAGVNYFDDPEAQESSESDILEVCLNKLEYFHKLDTYSLEDKIKGISGLLFVCFQGDIDNQFSKIQTQWADASLDASKRDPIVGHPKFKGRNKLESQKWPIQWNDNDKQNYVDYNFYDCVKNKGGEFFFAPSITFLTKLS